MFIGNCESFCFCMRGIVFFWLNIVEVNPQSTYSEYFLIRYLFVF